MKTFLRKLKTAFSFTPSQWKMLGLAYALLLKARFLLFFSSPRLIENALAEEKERNASQKIHPKQELLRLFQIAWRYQFGKPRCLPKALAEQAFLSHSGYPTQLRIGVRKVKGELEAHAWCEDLQEVSREQAPETFHVIEPLSP